MNAGDITAIALLLVAAAFALRSCLRKPAAKPGDHACSGNCSGCGCGCGKHSPAPFQKKDQPL